MTMDIRIARLLMLMAEQSHDAATTLLAKHEDSLRRTQVPDGTAKELADMMAQARHGLEEAIPAVKAAIQMSLDAQAAIGEIMRAHTKADRSGDET